MLVENKEKIIFNWKVYCELRKRSLHFNAQLRIYSILENIWSKSQFTFCMMVYREYFKVQIKDSIKTTV